MRAAPIAMLFAVLGGFDAEAAGPAGARNGVKAPGASLAETEAARLLMTYVTSTPARRLPDLRLERFHPEVGPASSVWPNASYFYYFTVMWRGAPEGGSAVVGNFAVDKRDGEIFEAASCQARTSPAFRRARQALLAKHAVTRKLDMHRHRMRPDC
jgi:hypothetical protein